MIDFIMNMSFILADATTECKTLLGSGDDPKSLYSLLQYAFLAIKFITPALVLVLCIMDFVRATAAQDEKVMKDAQLNCIKRIIAGVIIFFVPNLINILLELSNLAGTCGIE